MSLKSYSDAFAGCSPTIMGLNQVADIVAAVTPPAGTPPVAQVSQPSLVSKVSRFAPGLAGAGAGGYAWKKHRVLGALLGHAVVQSGYDYMKGRKREALCQLAVEGAGVGGALYYKKHPVLGWLGGVVAGAVATYFVPGSPVRNEAKRRGL